MFYEIACIYCQEPIDPVHDVSVTCSVCGEEAHEEHVVWVPSPTRSRWLDPDEQVPVCLACEARVSMREAMADAS